MTASSFFRARNTRSAAVAALFIAAGFVGSAHAEGDYNISREALITQAAASAPAHKLTNAEMRALLEQFRIGENDSFGTAEAPRPLMPVATIGERRDVVGTGGQQDALAIAIYHPGSRSRSDI